MSLTSFSFFVFLLIAGILYYLSGKFQKYVLLGASLYFYISVSTVNKGKLIFVMLYILAVTYFGAILIERTKGKVRGLITFAGIAGLVGLLFVTKYAYNLLTMFGDLVHSPETFSWLKVVPIVGISYFVLSAIGYMVDVSWESYQAERNIGKVALFLFYFPQVISGPVTRFGQMKEQFDERHPLQYEQITNGIRRMLWGYFKKLVISERFAVVVTAVYSDYTAYSGIGIIAATLCYAVRLYTDFSGCMDIIMGASELFGIRLPENFHAPFFSKTVQEFWQRWHITLGGWFKDYVMYPVQKSSPMVKVGKKSKELLGKKRGKKVPFYLSMFLLWVLIGIWHGGTDYYFVASAGVPFVLLMAGDLCQPLFQKITKALKINTECASFRLFRCVRTSLLLCICWVFVCTANVDTALGVIRHVFTDFVAYTPMESAIAAFGLDVMDVLLMAVGLVLLFVADKLEEEGTSLGKVMDGQDAAFRYLAIYAEFFCIVMYGMIGTSAFIYFQF